MKNNINKISICAALCSLGLVCHAQTVIDPLTGSLSDYTTTLILDNSDGVGDGVSFSDGSSGLQANYVGSTSEAEQALFLAPVNDFSTVFAVGDTLSVDVSIPISGTEEDFGLAVADSATPPAASSGNGWNSRTSFDYASVSVRPSQTAVRGGADVGFTAPSTLGTLNTSYVASAAANTVTQLYIQWASADTFNLGYITSSGSVQLYSAVFSSGSIPGAAIGFYGDIRATGTSLGDFTNLTITPVPEPSTLAMCGLGFAGLIVAIRRKTISQR